MPSAEMQAVIDQLRSLAATMAEAPTVADQRANYDMIGGAYPVVDGTAVDTVDAGGRPAQWVAAPGADPSRAVLYLHGGGYVIGSPVSHRQLASRISQESGARVLVLDYRLAPEHPFPAAVDDATAAYRWLLAQGLANTSVAVAGDSAGGGLTVATLVALRDGGAPRPACGVCLSPWIDLEQTAAAYTVRAASDPIVAAEGVKGMAEAYLAGQDAHAPLAAPLYADLTGLPPLLVEVGTAEVLYDDSTRLVANAAGAGVPVRFQPSDGAVHVFQQLAPYSPEATESLARIGAFIREHTA